MHSYYQALQQVPSSSNSSLAKQLVSSKNEEVANYLLEGSIWVSQEQLQISSNSGSQDRSQEGRSERKCFLFGEQDKKLVKELMRKQRQKEESLERKSEEYLEKIRQLEAAEAEEAESSRKQMFAEKRREAIKGMREIQQRKQQRSAMDEEANRELARLHKQKKLFQKYQEEWDHILQDYSKQKQDTLKQYRQMKKLDMDDVKRHQQQYDQKLYQLQSMRESRANTQIPLQKFYESTFLSRVVEADHEAKQRLGEKQALAKQFAEKRANFAQIVREKFKPRSNSQSQLQPIPESTNMRSLSHLEVFRKGNEYMSSVNKELANSKISSTRLLQKPHTQTIFKYRNYLTEMRMTKKHQNSETLTRKRRTEDEIKRIMLSKNKTEQEKLIEAKTVLLRLEGPDYQSKDPSCLVESINAKIELLKHVS